MASSGKKKTTMAKYAREARLRERRLSKQAKKDARRQASSEDVSSPEGTAEAVEVEAEQERTPVGEAEEPEKADASAKDYSLRRLRDASDEELAVFEGSLRRDALAEGATELELRKAQSGHPGHC
jgi:hypothetical protein